MHGKLNHYKPAEQKIINNIAVDQRRQNIRCSHLVWNYIKCILFQNRQMRKLPFGNR